jgi:hypothetical protein
MISVLPNEDGTFTVTWYVDGKEAAKWIRTKEQVAEYMELLNG